MSETAGEGRLKVDLPRVSGSETMNELVAPEVWYGLFWLAAGVTALALARIVLVNPIIRAIRRDRQGQ
jgi:hypothetical protein